ncbi:hypothetical protein PMAYCL1PPCAC_26992, partial [Pristionchus mayeri]
GVVVSEEPDNYVILESFVSLDSERKLALEKPSGVIYPRSHSTSIERPSDHSPANLMLLHELRPSVVMSPRSHSSPIDLTSWESLPWPALTRLFRHLWTTQDCSDLANLAQVSDHFDGELCDILSAPIEKVFINGIYHPLSTEDLSLCARLLQGARIHSANFDGIALDDITAPFILSIAFLTKYAFSFLLKLENSPVPLSDPAAIFSQLNCRNVIIEEPHNTGPLFYDRPHSYWNEFLNEVE